MNKFTPKQLAAVLKTLEKALPENETKCLTRGELYEMMQDHMDMEQYKFEACISTAAKNGTLSGFYTRTGRSGGICRIGAFKEYEAQRKKCVVTINGKAYRVNASEAQVFAFIVSILEGKPTTNGTDAVYVGNAAYKLPAKISATHVLKNYISNKYKAKDLDEDIDGCIDRADII